MSLPHKSLEKHNCEQGKELNLKKPCTLNSTVPLTKSFFFSSVKCVGDNVLDNAVDKSDVVLACLVPVSQGFCSTSHSHLTFLNKNKQEIIISLLQHVFLELN